MYVVLPKKLVTRYRKTNADAQVQANIAGMNVDLKLGIGNRYSILTMIVCTALRRVGLGS